MAKKSGFLARTDFESCLMVVCGSGKDELETIALMEEYKPIQFKL